MNQIDTLFHIGDGIICESLTVDADGIIYHDVVQLQDVIMEVPKERTLATLYIQPPPCQECGGVATGTYHIDDGVRATLCGACHAKATCNGQCHVGCNPHCDAQASFYKCRECGDKFTQGDGNRNTAEEEGWVFDAKADNREPLCPHCVAYAAGNCVECLTEPAANNTDKCYQCETGAC